MKNNKITKLLWIAIVALATFFTLGQTVFASSVRSVNRSSSGSYSGSRGSGSYSGSRSGSVTRNGDGTASWSGSGSKTVTHDGESATVSRSGSGTVDTSDVHDWRHGDVVIYAHPDYLIARIGYAWRASVRDERYGSPLFQDF